VLASVLSADATQLAQRMEENVLMTLELVLVLMVLWETSVMLVLPTIMVHQQSVAHHVFVQVLEL